MHELQVDTVGSWTGTAVTLTAAIVDASPIFVAISAAITIAFTLRKWYLLERKVKR
jgi:hypothetical protein